MTSVDENNVNFGTIDRIRSARDNYNGAINSRYAALVMFYDVYCDAKTNAAVASAIETEYATLPNCPKTKHLSNKIAYIAFSAEKRRVSEVHKILVAAHAAGVTVVGMLDWLIINERGVRRGGQASHRGPKLPDLYKVAKSIHSNARNKVVLSKAPYPAACEPEDYLVQVCQKQSDGTFVSVWLHADRKGTLEFLRPAVAQAAKPATYDEMVAEAAASLPQAA